MINPERRDQLPIPSTPRSLMGSFDENPYLRQQMIDFLSSPVPTSVDFRNIASLFSPVGRLVNRLFDLRAKI